MTLTALSDTILILDSSHSCTQNRIDHMFAHGDFGAAGSVSSSSGKQVVTTGSS